MQTSYKKECYDENEDFKVHYTHGVAAGKATLDYPHYDGEFIMEYYRKGEATMRIEDNVYNIISGDIVLLRPDELHLCTINDDCYIEKIVIHVKESFFNRFDDKCTLILQTIFTKKKGINNVIHVTDEMSDLLNDCLDFAKSGNAQSLLLLICRITELLVILHDKLEHNNNHIPEKRSQNMTVDKVIEYINHHHTEDITLEDIAVKLHFSKYYISHLFKQKVGVSPYDYLIIRRIYTCNNLIRNKYTIKEACFLSGFNNYSNFYRLYKKHMNITPQQFKEQIR